MRAPLTEGPEGVKWERYLSIFGLDESLIYLDQFIQYIRQKQLECLVIHGSVKK
jgi:hypothetical protein